jgi:hypothetical protein
VSVLVRVKIGLINSLSRITRTASNGK